MLGSLALLLFAQGSLLKKEKQSDILMLCDKITSVKMTFWLKSYS